jgi:hypothetical protein
MYCNANLKNKGNYAKKRKIRGRVGIFIGHDFKTNQIQQVMCHLKVNIS